MSRLASTFYAVPVEGGKYVLQSRADQLYVTDVAPTADKDKAKRFDNWPAVRAWARQMSEESQGMDCFTVFPAPK